jgi:hypothetical protein
MSHRGRAKSEHSQNLSRRPGSGNNETGDCGGSSGALTRIGSLFRDIATFYLKIGFFLKRLDTKQNVLMEQVTCFETLFCLGKSLAKYRIRRQEEIDH